MWGDTFFRSLGTCALGFFFYSPLPSLGLCSSIAPLGLNKCISMINPGLAPWALQEYRPFRALCGLA